MNLVCLWTLLVHTLERAKARIEGVKHIALASSLPRTQDLIQVQIRQHELPHKVETHHDDTSLL